jgi:AcrR family transcriptional regulator
MSVLDGVSKAELDVSPGLRERKRLATKRAIEFAVLELSRETGLDQVTVDDISRTADISPRTFFNYFPSKEAALIGDAPMLLAGDFVDSFVAGGAHDGASVIDDLRILIKALSDADQDRELTQLRRKVLRDYPHLFAQKVTSMRSFEERLCDVVLARLEADALRGGGSAGTISADSAGDLVSRARLVAFVGIAAMRHAWSTWADDSNHEPFETIIDRSFAALPTLF